MTSSLKKSRVVSVKTVSMSEDIQPDFEDLSGDRADKLISYIDDNVIGKGSSFCGPFGRRKVIYCDYNGSGRALQFLEEHINRDVLPTHATQCTAMSHTSLQTNLYRSEARQLILKSVGGDEENDVVVLGGSPHRLLRTLIQPQQKIVAFVSARETANNVNIWINCGADIIKIRESKEGYLDLNTLEAKLQEYTATGTRMIGFFAAVSKLTGVLADDVATTLLLHQYGALAFWDYTLVAPTAVVEMNPTFPGVEEHMVTKDAVFFNCEKFVGGVQGPCVAVLKKSLFRGTAFYSDNVKKLTEYYEDCTAVEAVRAGLVVQLRDTVGLGQVADKQEKITRQVLAHIKNIPELILLGSDSPSARRLPIFSLLVKHPRGTFLHHNFVCAVLNDVFGIQARGGLSGSLSYGQDVLGIDKQLLNEYEKLLNVELQREIQKQYKNDAKPSEYNEHLRPGFFRISLPFFMSENELAFVLEALKMVATEGWKILPQYVVNPKNGQWRHYTNAVFRDRKSLFSIRYTDGKMTANDRRFSGPGIFPQTYTECLQTARNLFSRARKLAMKCSVAEQEIGFNPKIEFLRWFMLPKEAHDLLLGKSVNVKQIVPFDPSGFTGARKSVIAYNSKKAGLQGARHLSLSAIDDCHLVRLKNKLKTFSRDSSVVEVHREEYDVVSVKPPPVQFAVGECVSPIKFKPQVSNAISTTLRSRCYSLGSESVSPILSPQTQANLGLISQTNTQTGFCHCGSQTDLQSLDDPMFSPGKTYYQTSDCSHNGRVSPVSITSQTSEELEAYVKEISNEIATEIKTELRGVISQVEDVLENNSESLDNNGTDRNSILVMEVAEYLMGMSKEMASEMKQEIREMVNQVDDIMSPNSSRRNSPPNKLRQRIGSGSDLGLNLTETNAALKKSPTSPVNLKDLETIFKTSPRKAVRESGNNNTSFNSSETSTPDTIIQVVSTNLDVPSIPKSVSSNKLSDEELCCSQIACRQFNSKKWYQNPSISSQDSGINLSFTETDSFHEFVKRRTHSDPTTCKGKLRCALYHDKTEVPDIIEGVPVCSGDYQNQSYASSQTNTKDEDSDSERMRRLSDSSGNSDTDFAVEDDGKWRQPPKHIWKSTVEAIHEFCMIRHQDKVLVCISGGQRSLALLHSVKQYQCFARTKGLHFTFGAIYVNDRKSKVEPLELMSYCKDLGIKFIYQDTCLPTPKDKCISRASWLCGWAERSVRTAVYNAANEHGYTVAALAHTLDSAAQAFLATAFDAGVLRTLKAHYYIRERNIRVIRPFIYVREKNVLQFAETKLLPDLRLQDSESMHLDNSLDSCEIGESSHESSLSPSPREEGESRRGSEPFCLARNILLYQERNNPCLFNCLKSALHPLIRAKSIDRELREYRQRKKSVIQMKNGIPVYDSEEGTDEEPVP